MCTMELTCQDDGEVRSDELRLVLQCDAKGRKRLVEPALADAVHSPCEMDEKRLGGLDTGRSARSARSSQSCASSNRPWYTAEAPSVPSAMQAIGSASQPCASAMAIASRHRSRSPTNQRCPVARAK